MKKLIVGLVLSLGTVLAVPAATFAASPNMVVGHIYNSNHVGVNNASVNVVCDTPGGGSITANTSSSPDGSYTVTLNNDACPTGAPVHVTAHTGNAVGSNTVSSGNNFNSTAVNVTVDDVSVGLPEMGTIMGGLAAVGAGGAFLVIRRKQQAN